MNLWCCSTCSTWVPVVLVLPVVVVVLVVPCSEWDSTCWLRYLFHLKLFIQSVINKRKRKMKRKGKRERERERERERKRKKKKKKKKKRGREEEEQEEEEKQEEEEEEEQREREREEEEEEGEEAEEDELRISSGKKMLQLWTLRTNLLKWSGPSHGPLPWKFVEQLFFNKGLISGLIILGKAWALNFSITFVRGFSFFSWLQDQLWKSLLQFWNLRTNLLKWTGPSHGPVPCWFFPSFCSIKTVFGMIIPTH